MNCPVCGKEAHVYSLSVIVSSVGMSPRQQTAARPAPRGCSDCIAEGRVNIVEPVKDAIAILIEKV